jgi:hypothetical protein
MSVMNPAKDVVKKGSVISGLVRGIVALMMQNFFGGLNERGRA